LLTNRLAARYGGCETDLAETVCRVDTCCFRVVDEGYSPLRSLYLVTWKNEGRARELRSLSEVQEAEEKGEVKIERQEVVINEPFLT
jgi:hypothetical protein